MQVGLPFHEPAEHEDQRDTKTKNTRTYSSEDYVQNEDPTRKEEGLANGNYLEERKVNEPPTEGDDAYKDF